MYNKVNIKPIFIISLLIVSCPVTVVQAMMQPTQSNLTQIAEGEEAQGRPYISHQGLIYKKSKKVKKRIEHLKEHLQADTSDASHTYFKQGTEAYQDVVGFIDKIFAQFALNNLYIGSKVQTSPPGIDLGTITLHNKVYKVLFMHNQPSNQHIYDIIPPDTQDTPYPVIGTKSIDGVEKHGYRLMAKHTLNGCEIQSFFRLIAVNK